MIRRGAVSGLAVCFAACGVALMPALGATDPAAVNALEGTVSQRTLNVGTEPAAPAGPVARERALPRGNPLWAVPLSTLSATQERPLFSPSRRPPPPAVVAAPRAPIVAPPPPKPQEPDHPLLTVEGTVVSESDGIGIFLDEATNNVIRLRIGENHAGWTLRSVHGREASFEKDHRTATLVLPPPGAPQSSQPSIPIGVAAQAAATWIDGDGQLISPPVGRRLQSTAAPRRAPQPSQPFIPIGAGTQAAATWTDGDGQLITPPIARGLQSTAAPPRSGRQVGPEF
jgi:general secretion pathway protein N